MPKFPVPQFHVEFPITGSSLPTGVVFQIHIVIVAAFMGIAIIAPFAEYMGLRHQNEWWERLAHNLGSTMGKVFAFGATWAVFALVMLYGFYPRATGILGSIFFWPWVAITGVWFVMTVTAYAYGETWDRFKKRRKLHMAIGWTFVAAAFVFISLVVELSSYQLTPTLSTTLPSATFNPSWLTEVMHRQIGNLSYAGLLLAAYAGTQVLYFARNNKSDREFYDWVGYLGLVLGVGVALLQPIAGWFYARQVQIGSPGAFRIMMVGENAWGFLVQTGLVGILLFLSNLYMALTVRRGSPNPGTVNWMVYSTGVVGLLTLLGVVPQQLPLGQMTPWKYVSLMGMDLLSLMNLVLYVRVSPTFDWGKVGRGSQMVLVTIGVVVAALMITMGIIRESARGGYLIYPLLGPGQGQQIEQP